MTLFRHLIAERGAWAVNLGKNAIAGFLLGVTTLALGQGPALMRAPAVDLWLIALSGVVGMTLGDTALFAAVHRIGVHRALLLQTLAPVFAAILAFALHGERLGPSQLLGAAATLLGVAVVVAPRRLGEAVGGFTAAGTTLATLAAAGQGTGVVLAKMGMETVPFLAASFIRLSVAAVGVLAILAATGRMDRVARLRGSVARLLPPTLLGTYLAVLMMMAGIAFAPAAIAAVLLSTPPIFSLFIDARVEGTPITLRGLGGTLLAVAGVGILTL